MAVFLSFLLIVFYGMKFMTFLQQADANYTTINTFYLLCAWYT